MLVSQLPIVTLHTALYSMRTSNKALHKLKRKTPETSSTAFLQPHRNKKRKVSSPWSEAQNILELVLFSTMPPKRDHSCGLEVSYLLSCDTVQFGTQS